jgi:poly(A) polymerase
MNFPGRWTAMSLPDPARAFAVDVVHKLRAAGYEALWAGGCVRDQLLGLTPKDYDVATNAPPEQIRDLFGRRRTLAIGAAFGVVSVLGPKGAGQIEVATFRSDGAYLDGRHPESVTFSTPELDAQRRDFTINGLFYDPIKERVIDYVDGQADLEQQLVRAIGDPQARFQEDKLRLIRAVRFAATFGFAIEPATKAAVQQLAPELVAVSAERIAAELRRMLAHPRRTLAVQLLQECELLAVVLPESTALDPQHPTNDPAEATLRWQLMLATLDRLTSPNFPVGLACLLRPLCHLPAEHPALDRLRGEVAAHRPESFSAAMCRRWKLSGEEIEIVGHLLSNEEAVRASRQLAWPQLQRLLVSPHVEELLQFASAVCQVLDGNDDPVAFCREKLALPPAELNPQPLLTGNDLKQLGLRPGPQFKRLLDALRDAQLDKLVGSRDDALAFVEQLAHRSGDSQNPSR